MERAAIFPKARVFIYGADEGRTLAVFLTSMKLPPLLLAQSTSSSSWHATSLGEALFYTAIFSLAGTFLAILGYKLFDYCTPGKLHEEIIKNRNLAAAVVGGSVIIGVCIVVAAAIMG
jgi:uncharacterized membrane protein YjfL (UPF0719 family)